MAEVLEVFPVANGKGARIGYRHFCDGKVYRIVAGVDFPAATTYQAVANGLYVAAMRSGRKARIHKESKSPLTLVVQALPVTK